MNNEAEQLESAIRFLNGMMDEEEAQRFQAAIDNDPELKAKIEAYDVVAESVNWLQYEGLKAQMQNIVDEKPKSIFLKTTWLAIAAGICFLVFGGFLSYANLFYSNGSIADAFYEAPNFSTYRSDGSALDNAKNEFENGNYDNCISLLLIEEDKSEAKLFLLAHAYLKSGAYESAIEHFKNLSGSGDERYASDASWYIVIAHLFNKDEEKAMELLERIKEREDSPYKRDAIELERQIKSGIRFFVFE